MTDKFPWTEEETQELLRAFTGNTSFSVKWPWASFHFTGFSALRWAAFNNMSVPEFYETLIDLSVPSAPKKYFKDFQNAGILDFDDRIIPLNPALSMKQTFKLAKENISEFKRPDLVLLTVSDLLKRDSTIENLWRPIFKEDSTFVEKWLSKDLSLLNSFQSLKPWGQLKVVECLVGVAKPLSVLNFERIY